MTNQATNEVSASAMVPFKSECGRRIHGNKADMFAGGGVNLVQPMVPTNGKARSQLWTRMKTKKQISSGNATGMAFGPTMGAKISRSLPINDSRTA